MVRIYTHDVMARHDAGYGHPERPERYAAALAGLSASLPRSEAVEVGLPALSAVHDDAYVQAVLATRGDAVRFDADTATSPDSIEAALRAAGAVLSAVDAALDHDERGFAVVRPPGHHAEHARAMGFCLFNNVAVAAQHARARGAERVAIVDWDVHHGNGTQHLFEDRDDILFFSSHEGYGQYPGTGAATERGRGAGEGFTINAPLRPGSGDTEVLEAFDSLLLPALARFKPDLVLISAGFDAHADDPLGGLRVSDDGFSALARRVCDAATAHGSGRVVGVLEGGYDLGVLERCVARTVAEMGA